MWAVRNIVTMGRKERQYFSVPKQEECSFSLHYQACHWA